MGSLTARMHHAGYRSAVARLVRRVQTPGTPVNGRIFSGQVIRDNLDIGRPDQIGLVFDRRIVRKGRRATPGRFRTVSSAAGAEAVRMIQ